MVIRLPSDKSRSFRVPATRSTPSISKRGEMYAHSWQAGRLTDTYDGASSRPASVAYPNGQEATYAYYGSLGDRRIQTIHQRRPGL
jgi:hypothetical protein